MRRLSATGWTAFLGALWLFSVEPGAAGDGPGDRSQRELEASRLRGALLYQIHCASCHGLDGRGGGPVAADLRVKPTDLTDLLEPAASGRLELPVEDLRHAIDGRDEIRGHGSREMPVWGLSFQDPGRDADQEEVVSEKIDSLIEHLRTLQEAGTGTD